MNTPQYFISMFVTVIGWGCASLSLAFPDQPAQLVLILLGLLIVSKVEDGTSDIGGRVTNSIKEWSATAAAHVTKDVASFIRGLEVM